MSEISKLQQKVIIKKIDKETLNIQILETKITDFNHNSLFGTILSNEKRNFAA